MTRPNECLGCNGHFNPFMYEDARTCPLPPKFKDDNCTYKCPCVLCLVKAICNRSCTLAHTYNHHIKLYFLQYKGE